MKWYEWVLIVSIIIVLNITTYVVLKKDMQEPVYVVDIQKIVEKEFDEKSLKDIYEGKVPVEIFIKKKKKLLDELYKILQGFEKPVYIKQAVAGGNVIDITKEVEKLLR